MVLGGRLTTREGERGARGGVNSRETSKLEEIVSHVQADQKELESTLERKDLMRRYERQRGEQMTDWKKNLQDIVLKIRTFQEKCKWNCRKKNSIDLGQLLTE